MRITNSMLKRNYLRNMNSTMTNLSKSNERMSSQRAFTKSSENVADANRALKVRRQLVLNEQSNNSIRDAQGKFAAAEDNLRSINQIMQNVNERTIQGLNGTIADEDKQKIAREISNLQNEILQISNMQYGDNYLFSAAGGPTKGPPFVVDANGDLSFNGTPVDSIQEGTGANAGIPVTIDPNTGLEVQVPYNKKNYIDVGLGFTVNGTGANAKLDTKTGVQSSISGLEVFGFGVNADGVPKNLYSLLGSIADDLNNGNDANLSTTLEQVRLSTNTLMMGITDLGNRTSFIEQTSERLENDTLNLQTVQNKLESISIQEESIYNKDFEMSWMITLQMGSKIIPASIFDFLR